MKKTKPVVPLVFEADSPILDTGDMRPEYDLSQWQQVGERGRHTKAMRQGARMLRFGLDGTAAINRLSFGLRSVASATPQQKQIDRA